MYILLLVYGHVSYGHVSYGHVSCDQEQSRAVESLVTGLGINTALMCYQ